MEIRQLLIRDYQKYKSEIMTMMKEIYSNNFNISSHELNKISNEKTKNLEKYIDDGSAILIGCINDNKLIAFAWLYVHEFFDEKRIHINQIAVNSSFNGKGIGKKLMIKIEEEAIRRGVDVIDLFVMESNEVAMKMYEGLSFETEKRYMIKKLKVNK